jgi:hypothetical protein
MCAADKDERACKAVLLTRSYDYLQSPTTLNAQQELDKCLHHRPHNAVRYLTIHIDTSLQRVCTSVRQTVIELPLTEGSVIHHRV